jgi:transposase
MKRYETLETLFRKVDLSFAGKVLKEIFHPEDSPGRPPRKPIGVFKAHLLRRLRHIPSDRMLVRQLWKDPRLKRICDIEVSEPPYGIAVLSRFRSRVGPEKLAFIVDDALGMLVKKGRIKVETLALDSTFIKAYSRRNLIIVPDTVILNQGLEERLKRKIWLTDFIWRWIPRANCLSPWLWLLQTRTRKGIPTVYSRGLQPK